MATLLESIREKAKKMGRKIVLTESDDPRNLIAASKMAQTAVAKPVLVGDADAIKKLAAENNISLDGVEIVDILKTPNLQKYIDLACEIRKNKGLTQEQAREWLKDTEAIMSQTASKIELVLDNVRRFLARLTPKVALNPDPSMEYSLSLGITPKDYSPEEILSLPERMAVHIGKHIVVCIDEFQQVGEWPDSLIVQKRMRGAWQHHTHASYCLFGSRQHMMNRLFQNKRMPFYQFGEPNYLQPISTEDWIPFIQSKFEKKGLSIEGAYVCRICDIVGNQSSYVQQLSWNVMLNTDLSVTDETIQAGVNDLLMQCTPLFMEQTGSLTTYQMNMLRAIIDGQHTQWTSQEVLSKYGLGTKSNVAKMQKVLLERDFIVATEQGLFLSDPVMGLWMQHRKN